MEEIAAGRRIDSRAVATRRPDRPDQGRQAQWARRVASGRRGRRPRGGSGGAAGDSRGGGVPFFAQSNARQSDMRSNRIGPHRLWRSARGADAKGFATWGKRGRMGPLPHHSSPAPHPLTMPETMSVVAADR